MALFLLSSLLYLPSLALCLYLPVHLFLIYIKNTSPIHSASSPSYPLFKIPRLHFPSLPSLRYNSYLLYTFILTYISFPIFSSQSLPSPVAPPIFPLSFLPPVSLLCLSYPLFSHAGTFPSPAFFLFCSSYYTILFFTEVYFLPSLSSSAFFLFCSSYY